MKIIYYSLTGNVRRFLNKTGYPHISPIESVSEDTVDEPFIIATSTIGFGEVPEPVQSFLERNHHHLRGVIASGNRNWGQNFAKSGNTISAMYRVPLLMKIELHGNEHDLKIFWQKVEELNENTRREAVQTH